MYVYIIFNLFENIFVYKKINKKYVQINIKNKYKKYRVSNIIRELRRKIAETRALHNTINCVYESNERYNTRSWFDVFRSVAVCANDLCKRAVNYVMRARKTRILLEERSSSQQRDVTTGGQIHKGRERRVGGRCGSCPRVLPLSTIPSLTVKGIREESQEETYIRYSGVLIYLLSSSVSSNLIIFIIFNISMFQALCLFSNLSQHPQSKFHKFFATS